MHQIIRKIIIRRICRALIASLYEEVLIRRYFSGVMTRQSAQFARVSGRVVIYGPVVHSGSVHIAPVKASSAETKTSGTRDASVLRHRKTFFRRSKSGQNCKDIR